MFIINSIMIEPTCPCMFMMTTVLERLHTTKCSGFLGSRMTLLTVMSVPADVPRGLKVLVHSVVFTFHTWHRFNVREKDVGHHEGHTRWLQIEKKWLKVYIFFNCRFPYLHCTIWRGTDDVVAVRSECGLVDKWSVTTELLKTFTGLESVDSSAKHTG